MALPLFFTLRIMASELSKKSVTFTGCFSNIFECVTLICMMYSVTSFDGLTLHVIFISPFQILNFNNNNIRLNLLQLPVLDVMNIFLGTWIGD